MERFDVAVVGLGAMGSAACAHLARRGVRVAGFERFAFGHDGGSSGGRSRIIRKAYFEDVAYVPLLERAYVLWRDLERRTSTRLLDMCGVLVVGDASGDVASGVLNAAREHDIAVETFDTGEARRAYPQLRILDGEIAILERDAGMVAPEAAIVAHLRLARDLGASLAEHTPVARWEAMPSGLVRVFFTDGSAIEAARLIVTAGAWAPELLVGAGFPLDVQRNVQYWFNAASEAFSRPRFPAFFLDRPSLPAPVYGMPDTGDGVKIALHGFGETTRPDALVRTVAASEIEAMREIAESFMPGAAGSLRSTKVCMYVNSPDRNFIVGMHPESPNVIIAAGFSGHGYKFAPAIGEVLAELALDGGSTCEIGFLRPERLAL